MYTYVHQKHLHEKYRTDWDPFCVVLDGYVALVYPVVRLIVSHRQIARSENKCWEIGCRSAFRGCRKKR